MDTASRRAQGEDGSIASTHRIWRPDIQGLRAVAVLSVLLFHLDIWPVRGGFVGVDVFFVISGYLISQGIFSDVAQGRFSLRRFYERRIRRIVPVFLAVTVATTVIVHAALFPTEYVAYAKTLVASCLFAANVYFYVTHNYFGPSPESVPLLHLWSLGVEEQFYLLFPLFALWGALRTTGRCRLLIVFAGLLSFGASALLTHRHSTAAFYLFPFRAFEFLIGSYLALPGMPGPGSARAARLAGLGGWAALTYSTLAFDTGTEFPGVAAAVPCIGTGLLIWAGTGWATAPTRCLSLRGLTLLGDRSYALYMVHWPVIVMIGQWRPNMGPVPKTALAITLSILLATALFYAVEQPVRRAKFGRKSSFFAGSAAALAGVACLGLGIVGAKGFPGRTEARAAHYLSYLDYDPTGMTRSRTCFLEVEQDAASYDTKMCLPPAGPGHRQAVLWGDSIAAHLYAGLSEALKPHGVLLGQATASACPAAVGYDAPNRPFCRAFNDRVMALLLQRKPSLVIIAGSWGDPGSFRAMVATVERLRAASIPVILIGPEPYYKEAVPKILARRMLDGFKGNPARQDLQDFVPLRERWAETVAGEAQVPFVSILQAYCPGGDCPLVTEAGVPIEFDPLHFTLPGSRLVANSIAGAILKSL